MDSSKSGHSLPDQVHNQDKKHHYHSRGPSWKEEERKLKRGGRSSKPGPSANDAPLERLKNKYTRNSKDIMEVLFIHAHKMRDKYLAELQTLFSPVIVRSAMRPPDLQLDEPWNQQLELIDSRDEYFKMGLEKDLDAIKRHVEAVYEYHKEKIRHKDFTSLPIVVRQDLLRGCSQMFAAHPPASSMSIITSDRLIHELCASCAYRYEPSTFTVRPSQY